MKYFRFLLPVLLLCCSTNVFAQKPNCSSITFDLVGYYPGDKSVCSGFGGILTEPSYTASWDLTWYCYQTQTGSQYQSGAFATIYTTGHCYTSNGVLTDCAPGVSWRKVIPTTNTGYNQLYLTPENGVFEVVNGNSQCVYASQTPVMAQCTTSGCTTCRPPCTGSPIVVDVSGQGFFLTSSQNGVNFDIKGDTRPIQIGWTAKGAMNAFLALPAPDGLVHDGTQLFGNYTPQPASPTPNGFAALAVYDLPENGGNGDGIIDNRDAIFKRLRLWLDKNHDGICTPDEMYPLPSLGVNSISLDYKEDQKTDQYGNQFRYRAKANPGDPTDVGRWAYDVFFVIDTLTAKAGKCQIPEFPPLSPDIGRTAFEIIFATEHQK